jgi:adenylate kinase
MKNIVLVGPPGSGKGTQASLISSKFNIPAISAGEELRKQVERETEIGKKISKIILSGSLVSDSIIFDIIKNRISQSDCSQGYILDGFPRNIAQTKLLHDFIKDSNLEISSVFNFVAKDESVIIKRISGRFFCINCRTIYNEFFKNTKIEGICDNCGSKNFDKRKDDKAEIVEKRLKSYHLETNEIIEFYQKNNLLYSIDVLESELSIFENMVEAIEKS